MRTIYITNGQIDMIGRSLNEGAFNKVVENKVPSAQDQVKGKVNAGIMDGVTGCGMMEEEMEPGDWIEFRANYTCSWRQAGEVVNSKYRIDGNVLTLYDIDNSWYIPYSYQIKELTATRMVLRLDGGIWFQGWVELKREK